MATTGAAKPKPKPKKPKAPTHLVHGPDATMPAVDADWDPFSGEDATTATVASAPAAVGGRTTHPSSDPDVGGSAQDPPTPARAMDAASLGFGDAAGFDDDDAFGGPVAVVHGSSACAAESCDDWAQVAMATASAGTTGGRGRGAEHANEGHDGEAAPAVLEHGPGQGEDPEGIGANSAKPTVLMTEAEADPEFDAFQGFSP